MWLIDTHGISETRKRKEANRGVRRFFDEAQLLGDAVCVSVITVGEIRRGIDLVRHRGDSRRANQLVKMTRNHFDRIR